MIKIKCDVCGKNAIVRERRHKYCSKNCSKISILAKQNIKYHQRKKNLPKRYCSVCNIELISSLHQIKVCSDACRVFNKREIGLRYSKKPSSKKKQLESNRKLNNKKWLEKPNIRKCSVCGIKFLRKGTNATLCSDLCYRSAKSEWDGKSHRKRNPKKPQPCIVCGKMFIKSFDKKACKQKVCSDECKKERKASTRAKWNKINSKNEWAFFKAIRRVAIEDVIDPIKMPRGDKINCVVCGSKIKIKDKKRVTCSKECGKIHQYESQKARSRIAYDRFAYVIKQAKKKGLIKKGELQDEYDVHRNARSKGPVLEEGEPA